MATNAQKGEFTLTLGGTAYTLRMGTLALAALQEKFGTPEHVPNIRDIVLEVMKGRALYVQAFVWAGLQRYHPDITFEQVADLIDETSESDLRPLLMALGISTQPDPADLKELGLDKANPPEAQTDRPTRRARRRGGDRSISAVAAQV